jgi:hypothetical protein
VPLVFAPGEAFQFDWSEDWAIIGGEAHQAAGAHTKLSHSRAFIVRAYPLQTHEMLFDALTQAFRVLGGVPQRGIFDNMKTAVDRIGSARRGRSTPASPRWRAITCSSPSSATRPRGGRRAGREERPGCAPTAVAAHARFPDLDALNAWLEERVASRNGAQIPHGTLPGTIADVHAEEVASLMPLGRPFDGFVEHTKRVSPTCLVHFERNRYSVPASFANRPVSLRIYPDRIVIAAEGRSCASMADHRAGASSARGGRSMTGGTIWRCSSASPVPCATARPSRDARCVPAVAGHLLKRPGGDREMVEILALVLHHDEQAVLCAVELALEAGAFRPRPMSSTSCIG